MGRDDADARTRPAQDEAALAIAARHALHDEELVAAFATGSLDEPGEVERARGLIERCVACRDLHRDVASIGDALRMDARGTMRAPRDFRLTVEDAQRLGGRVVVRGFLAALRRSMQSFAQPIGASMAAMGIVGLLVGSAALSAGAASTPTGAGAGLAATNAPAQVQTGEAQTGPKSSDRSAAYGPEATRDTTPVDDPTPGDTAAADSNPAIWLIAGSVALLVAGVVLLFLTFRSGRGNSLRTRDS